MTFFGNDDRDGALRRPRRVQRCTQIRTVCSIRSARFTRAGTAQRAPPYRRCRMLLRWQREWFHNANVKIARFESQVRGSGGVRPPGWEIAAGIGAIAESPFR